MPTMTATTKSPALLDAYPPSKSLRRLRASHFHSLVSHSPSHVPPTVIDDEDQSGGLDGSRRRMGGGGQEDSGRVSVTPPCGRRRERRKEEDRRGDGRLASDQVDRHRPNLFLCRFYTERTATLEGRIGRKRTEDHNGNAVDWA